MFRYPLTNSWQPGESFNDSKSQASLAIPFSQPPPPPSAQRIQIASAHQEGHMHCNSQTYHTFADTQTFTSGGAGPVVSQTSTNPSDNPQNNSNARNSGRASSASANSLPSRFDDVVASQRHRDTVESLGGIMAEVRTWKEEIVRTYDSTLNAIIGEQRLVREAVINCSKTSAASTAALDKRLTAVENSIEGVMTAVNAVKLVVERMGEYANSAQSSATVPAIAASPEQSFAAHSGDEQNKTGAKAGGANSPSSERQTNEQLFSGAAGNVKTIRKSPREKRTKAEIAPPCDGKPTRRNSSKKSTTAKCAAKVKKSKNQSAKSSATVQAAKSTSPSDNRTVTTALTSEAVEGKLHEDDMFSDLKVAVKHAEIPLTVPRNDDPVSDPVSPVEYEDEEEDLATYLRRKKAKTGSMG